MNNTIQFKLNALRFGTPQTFRQLTIIPLFDEAMPSDFISLKTALERGLAIVTEVDDAGSVPELKVINKGTKPILIVDGEELVGAKQNRIVNTSILIAAASEIVIPVSCTESGRWHYEKAARHSPDSTGTEYRNEYAFASSDSMMYASARSAKSARVMQFKSMTNTYSADQSKVWEEVSMLHEKLGTSSQSSAMSDAYHQKEGDLSEYLAAFPVLPNQKGMIALVEDAARAVDFIANAEVYADLHEKLVKSFAVECLTMPELVAADGDETSADDNLKIKAWQLINQLDDAQESIFEPIGLGSDVRLDGEKIGAAALVYDNALAHLSIFSKENTMLSGDAFSTRRQRYF